MAGAVGNIHVIFDLMKPLTTYHILLLVLAAHSSCNMLFLNSSLALRSGSTIADEVHPRRGYC